MRSHFKPLVRAESAVDACARVLRYKILGGEIEPGQRLPPERQMAASFGVNRVTLRGALGQLVAARLLQVRQGRGYEVLNYKRSGGPDLLSSLLALAAADGAFEQVVHDLLLVRRHLAAALVERLTQVSPASLDTVSEAVDAMNEAVSRGASSAEIATADLAVIAELVRLTGSTVLAVCLNPIIDLVRDFSPLHEVIYAVPSENVLAYRMLVQRLDDPSPGASAWIADLLRKRDELVLERMRQQCVKGVD